MRPPGRRERGIALLAVLWVVALLSVMALDVLAAARREAGVAADAAIRAQLAAAADAGIALGIHALLQAEAEPGARGAAARFRPGAPPLEESFAGASLSIAITDESGRVDLNLAEPPLLIRLLEALDLPRPRAEALAAAIQDWSDQDDVPGARGGAELPAYRAAGLPVPPRNGAFRSVDELRHVLGMTPDLFARLAPAVTVHGQREVPDRETAGPLVLRALGAGGRAAASSRAGSAGAERREGSSALAGRAFRIEVEARLPEGLRRRGAVVRLTGDRGDPYWVHEYR